MNSHRRTRFYETPHHDTVTCHFDGDKVRLEFLNSITQISPGHKETRRHWKAH